MSSTPGIAGAVEGVELRAPVPPGAERVLTPEALAFVAAMHREFNPERERLLARRVQRQAEIDQGARPDFLTSTASVREGDWRVPPAPADLQDRRVEITGPVDRKMMINALNSGARVFMADFEDALSPTWENVTLGQVNLCDAVDRTITFHSPDGRVYRLNEEIATLVVRPRGWHLVEKHVWVDGKPIAGAFFDFGLYFYHNARKLLERGSGPYFYLPKMESHLEARLWHQVFQWAEDKLGVPRGSIRATVLIETILAAFEMDEILYELGEHAAGLNAGRWDYIFSVIKKFRQDPGFLLPDRAQVTMNVPFMRAYTQLLVKTCHRRGAHAIGGMAAFIPNRRDPVVTEAALAKVREDKEREAGDGFDGTWVAHPDLVPVATEVFDRVLGTRPNQLERLREDVRVAARDLLDVTVEGGRITEAGLRNNVSVAIQYMASWLRGTGAVAIYNLMEDAATAEIARAQVWQWVRHGAHLAEGPQVTADLVRRVQKEELEAIRQAVGDQAFREGRFEDAAGLFEQVALSRDFIEFLTLPAYDRLG
ncbi:MAG: malate synthase A [Bacillota bacterium]